MKDESALPGKRNELNVRSSAYPRLLPGNRIEFKIKAPDAQKVQINLGRIYDLTRNANGEWTGITDPLTQGFHYYFLIIDGVSVADPASESFYGCSMMTSGVEIPYPDDDVRFYMADVPHGDIRIKKYFSKTANELETNVCILSIPVMTHPNSPTRYSICNMAVAKMNVAGLIRDALTSSWTT